jgi:DNA-binding MarR family transcriptional regulator
MRRSSRRQAKRRPEGPGVRPRSGQEQPTVGTAIPDRDLETVAAAWTRVGVLFGVPAGKAPVDLEVLICQTAQVAPRDERLFVCAASWLATYHGFVNGRRLSALAAELTTTDAGASAVLGALLSLARTGAGAAPEFDAALSQCQPLKPARSLFDVMDSMETLRLRARQRALPLFAEWGLWHDDAALKPTAVRPLGWVLRVPELRVRALLGPSVEADLMTRALEGGVAVRDVARATGVSYAAAHAAAGRLVGRGLLTRERSAQRQLLRPTELARTALAARSRAIQGTR